MDITCLNKQKGGLAAITLCDKIYAIGGGDNIRSFSDVEMFDIDAGQWIFAKSMQQKVNLLLIALYRVLYCDLFDCEFRIDLVVSCEKQHNLLRIK